MITPKQIENVRTFLEQNPIINGSPCQKTNFEVLEHFISVAPDILKYHTAVSDNKLLFDNQAAERVIDGYSACLTIHLRGEKNCRKKVGDLLFLLPEALNKLMLYYKNPPLSDERESMDLQRSLDNLSEERMDIEPIFSTFNANSENYSDGGTYRGTESALLLNLLNGFNGILKPAPSFERKFTIVS